jgi:hypothetical protein
MRSDARAEPIKEKRRSAKAARFETLDAVRVRRGTFLPQPAHRLQRGICNARRRVLSA